MRGDGAGAPATRDAAEGTIGADANLRPLREGDGAACGKHVSPARARASYGSCSWSCTCSASTSSFGHADESAPDARDPTCTDSFNLILAPRLLGR